MVERIPILKIGGILLVTIQVDFHDRVALALQEDLTEKICSLSAKGVLIDISALEMVDSFMGRVLGNIAKTSKLLDCHTVLVGMQPAIAITITVTPDRGCKAWHVPTLLARNSVAQTKRVSVGDG